MHKSLKSSLSLLLSAVMLCSALFALPGSTFAKTLSIGSCGDNVNYSFDKTNGALTVSGTGAMTNFEYDADEEGEYCNSPFFKNSSIQSVTVKSGVTSVGDWAFSGCKNLKSIKLADTVTVLGFHAFSACPKLAKVELPDTLTKIDNFAFSCNSALEKITLPKNLKTIGEKAFEFCSSLKTIKVPNKVATIKGFAFQSCYALEKVKLGKTVKTIGKCAFVSCTSLKSVSMPATVTKICNDAFDACKKLKHVYYEGSKASWKKIEIGKNNKPLTAAKLHCTIPDSTIITELTAGKKAFSVKWKKRTNDTTGYQIQYSTKKDFSNAKSVTVKKNSTVSKTVKNLKGKKKYYVRIRTYQTVNNNNHYSSWSKTKTVTTNK